jgi:hypothetical protein
MTGYSVSPPLMLFDHPDSSVRSRTRTPRISRSPSSEVTLVLPLSPYFPRPASERMSRVRSTRPSSRGSNLVVMRSSRPRPVPDLLPSPWVSVRPPNHSSMNTADMISRCTIRQLFDPSFERRERCCRAHFRQVPLVREGGCRVVRFQRRTRYRGCQEHSPRRIHVRRGGGAPQGLSP